MDEAGDSTKKRKMSEKGVMSMQCLSCKYERSTNGVRSTTNFIHFHRECFVKFREAAVMAKEAAVKVREAAVVLRRKNAELERENEELERENKELGRENGELKANVDFLRHSPPSSHDDPIQYHPARSSPLSSDVTLVASDDSPDSPILANKFVLASRSPVFKAMLEIAMKESISGTIEISDVTHNSLHIFVNYLYTANVCLDEKIARDLLILAEKYQVKHLNELCEGYLVSNLNWDNSVSNYAFAYKYSAVKLLEASLSIITDNMDKFMKRDDYGELIKKDPSLVVGILEAYTKKQLDSTAKRVSC